MLLAGALAWPTTLQAAPKPEPQAPASTASATAVPMRASFDSSLLAGGGSGIDLSRFERGNPVSPGIYRLDVYANGRWVGRHDVRFEAPHGHVDGDAVACIDRALLDAAGIDLDKLPIESDARLAADAGCPVLEALLPQATARFDHAELRLDLGIPQIALRRTPRGYVDPKFWDPGITAGLLDYDVNVWHRDRQGDSRTSYFAGLGAGFNVGLWRLRHRSSLSGESGGERRWQNSETYAQRDIVAWRSQLTLGSFNTGGELFDQGIDLRGIKLTSDDRMLPDSLRGYAPVVRGTAQTNAKVTIRQNGHVIHETTIAPGPFQIDDLYPTGYGGALEVTITEADGRERSFEVPYASLAQLLRPGTSRYSVAVGRVRDEALQDEPGLTQATVQYGVSNILTAYAGATVSEHYRSALLGAAVNTPIGAVALDATAARTELPTSGARNGYSVHLSYSHLLPALGTSFSLAAHRYSTRDYFNLRDALWAYDSERRGLDTAPHRERNRFELAFNKALAERWGSLYLSGWRRSYWDREGTDTTFNLGYQNQFRSISYGASVSRSRDAQGRYDNHYLLSFALPLGRAAAPTLSTYVNYDENNGASTQAMLSGLAGADREYSYAASLAHNNRDGAASGSVSGSYRAPYALLGAGYGKGQGYSTASLSGKGAVVAHAGGLTFGQQADGTVALVSAPDAAGARVGHAAGVRLDSRGYAIVPSLMPYQRNAIELDPKGLPLSVAFEATRRDVTPHAGAVTLVRFETDNRRTALFSLRLAGGEPPPFGAELSDASGRSLGVVAQGGRALVRGLAQLQGEVRVTWTDADGRARDCRFDYQLAAIESPTPADGIERYEAVCRAASNAPSLRADGSAPTFRTTAHPDHQGKAR